MENRWFSIREKAFGVFLRMVFQKALLVGIPLGILAGCHRPTSSKPETAPTTPVTQERRYLGDHPSAEPNASSASTELAWWKDETAASGVQFTYRNGREGGHFTILETVGGGATLIDFDQDGDLDLLLPGGGTISTELPIQVGGLPLGLFQNDGSGRFTNVSHLVESPEPQLYSHGAFVSDFNRDGFPDLLITGYRGCRLLRNDQGQRFVDITKASGLQVNDWTTAAAWADVNRDGWPDLMVVGYVEWDGKPDPTCGDPNQRVRDACPPQKYPATPQRLFLNNQNDTFTEVPNAFEGSAVGKGLGAVAADLNGDGWVDFYVANDQVENQLYLGGPTFPLREVSVLSGSSGSEYGVAEGSMGIDAGDYDGDGRPDLWVTNYELEDNSLYQNRGQDLFRHSTVTSGLGGVGRPYVGFGTGFADFDLDGWLDLFVINGHVLYETGRTAYLQRPFLLHNVAADKRRRFQDITARHGGAWFQGQYAGRGAAVGDLDNDGDLDLVIVHQNEPVTVLFNQTQPAAWLCVELHGTVSDPDAIGASVHYQFNGREIVRQIRSGAGYLSRFDPRVLLPVNESDPLEITVRWLTGKSERYRDLKPNRTNRIKEGAGESP
jgi:hypothetical protein